MGKPLTEESKINVEYDKDGNVKNKQKFTLELNADIYNKLIDYLILTGRATGRNQLINDLIIQELEGKVLENNLIDLYQNPFYFDKKELLENKTVKATKKPILKGNQDEIFVVRRVPNNLDDFNNEFKTYCSENNKHIHTGYYIMPRFKGNDERHFTFRYDAEKEEIEINLVNPNDIHIVFNPLDDEKQKIKNDLIKYNIVYGAQLINKDFSQNEILYKFNIMYSYKVNLRLQELANKEKTEELTDEEKAEREKIYFEGLFF